MELNYLDKLQLFDINGFASDKDYFYISIGQNLLKVGEKYFISLFLSLEIIPASYTFSFKTLS